MLTFHGGVLPISGAGFPSVARGDARDGGRPEGAAGPSTCRAGPAGRSRFYRLSRAAVGSAAARHVVASNARPPGPLQTGRRA